MRQSLDSQDSIIKNDHLFSRPNGFEEVARMQKRKMLVNLFIRKLKQTIVRHKTQEHALLEVNLDEKLKAQPACEDWPQWVDLAFLILVVVSGLYTAIVTSLTLVFFEVTYDSIFIKTQILAFIWQIVIIIKQISHRDPNEDQASLLTPFDSWSFIVVLKENMVTSTIFRRKVAVRILLCIIFILILALPAQSVLSWLLRLFVTVQQLKSVSGSLTKLEKELIKNVYRENIWSLVEVFSYNFLFAHLVCLLMIGMADGKHESWLQSKGIAEQPWSVKYCWGYYWATTTMLTVGFGDITATTSFEATCMVFIEMMSCIVLGYNINCVGIIMNKIRSYDTERSTNEKFFRHLVQKNEIPTGPLTQRIVNYIRESSVIRRNFNLQEQNQFLSKLPTSFRSELLKQTNRRIWGHLPFFRMLSMRTLDELACAIEWRLAHPEEMIYESESPLDLIILTKGTYGYTCRKKESQLIQKYTVKRNVFRLLSLEFLKGRTLPFGVKVIDYLVVYRLDLTNLRTILSSSACDYQNFCTLRDKDDWDGKYLEVDDCCVCDNNEKHPLSKCPGLHYIPLRRHIVEKELSRRTQAEYRIANRNPTVFGSIFFENQNSIDDKMRSLNDRAKTPEGFIDSIVQNQQLGEIRDLVRFGIVKTVRHQRHTRIPLQWSSLTTKINHLGKNRISRQMERLEYSRRPRNSLAGGNSERWTSPERRFSIPQVLEPNLANQNAISIYREAAENIRDEVSRYVTIFNHFEWQVEVDVAYSFSYYFAKHNPSELKGTKLRAYSPTKRR